MIRVNLLRNYFRINTNKYSSVYKRNILVNDPAWIDSLLYDLPEGALAKDISHLLQVPYLSSCSETPEQIKAKSKYRGQIVGDHSRLFLSILTSHPSFNKPLYVHYLLSTTTAYSTLTKQAICALHGKQSFDQIQFFKGKYLVGGHLIEINLFNDIQDEIRLKTLKM